MTTIGRTSYHIGNQNALHYLTISTVEWTDVFTKRIYKDIVVDSMAHCRTNKGLELYGYVTMTNHLHLLARARQGFELSNILRDFKRHTAKHQLKALQENPQEGRREWMLALLAKAGGQNQKNKKWQFWRQDNHPVELYKAETIQQKLDYIHNNPVVAGYVMHPGDYLYSSARNYASLEYVLEVDFL